MAYIADVSRWFDPAYKRQTLDKAMFYPAYAHRQFVAPRHIIPTPYTTYEEAMDAARKMLCDDDDCGVFAFNKSEGKWLRVLGRDGNGNLKYYKE